jgi:hypothetical protein
MRIRISHLTYRIEPKPGGGFIAHPADPSAAPLEAPTREELKKKIQENLLAGVSAQFPGLKLPLDTVPTSTSNTTIMEGRTILPHSGWKS